MRRLLAVGLVFALFGCNHPTSEGTGSSSGSTSATGGGSGTTSSGSGSTSGGSSGSTGTTGTTGSGSYRGYVLFNNIDVTGFYTNHTVTAGFATEDAGINVDPLQDCSDGTPEPNGCCYRDNTGGNGDAGSDEFNPKVFPLKAGAHKLHLVGREPARLKSVSIRPKS